MITNQLLYQLSHTSISLHAHYCIMGVSVCQVQSDKISDDTKEIHGTEPTYEFV